MVRKVKFPRLLPSIQIVKDFKNLSLEMEIEMEIEKIEEKNVEGPKVL